MTANSEQQELERAGGKTRMREVLAAANVPQVSVKGQNVEWQHALVCSMHAAAARRAWWRAVLGWKPRKTTENRLYHPEALLNSKE